MSTLYSLICKCLNKNEPKYSDSDLLTLIYEILDSDKKFLEVENNTLIKHYSKDLIQNLSIEFKKAEWEDIIKIFSECSVNSKL
ncbi:hypothetical protein VKI22_03585 [Cyanobacterium aponinum UTEX 3221]|uniref:hypothetical protein n=1 Tax=Cyanobacterium aponinum TaxID=379064 RepID=UPI002B4C2023|nr:hypothetical protein [Cyanobacterium aponinum]WRL39193.1 hypothetical protein VKI22_03585 [Cyanobacterium aponinum UTEX 3221]